MQPITTLLGTRYPIIQGAMTQISEASLVAAVSEAGGLGVLATGGFSLEQVRSSIDEVRKKTAQPFGVNLPLFLSGVEEMSDMLIREGVKIIFTGGGSPARLIDTWKQHHMIVIPVIPSVAIAQKMERLGVDAVVAEGMESGGHIGKQTTMAMLPQVVDAVKIPVIAAGGIGDGRGMAAAFALGAAGVQLGTCLLTATECMAHPRYKQMILDADDNSTVITGELWHSATRCIRNPYAERILDAEKRRCSQEEFKEMGNGAFARAVYEGDVENGSVVAGQIAGLLTKECPVAEILEEMVSVCRKTMQQPCPC